MPDRKRKNRAMLLMVITAAMWSLGGIFIKLISWNPFLIAGVRSGISGSIMALYMAATRTRFKLNRYSLLAGVGLGCSATLFTIANKLTTAANAIVLQYTAPIFILLISAVFFQEKMRKQDVLVVCITMGGMVLFFLDQHRFTQCDFMESAQFVMRTFFRNKFAVCRILELIRQKINLIGYIGFRERRLTGYLFQLFAAFRCKYIRHACHSIGFCRFDFCNRHVVEFIQIIAFICVYSVKFQCLRLIE